ncbi:MAG: host attachment protein [Alphaproteobacteria bacterium]|nr:host attachment protein [Alphaproteobacteria bacterium]
MAQNFSFYQVTSVIWAVVSDGKQAYGFRYRKDEPVYKDKILMLRGEKPEAAPSGSKEAHSFAESPKRASNETVRNFIPTIAEKLESALENNSFDYIVMVAPKKTLDALRMRLSDKLKSRVLANMPDGYIYDHGGAVFALREEASMNFSSYTDAICRSLPPCCTRAEPRAYAVQANKRRIGGNGYEGDRELYVVQ